MEGNTFETIHIRPNWRCYVLRVGWLAVISLVLLFVGGKEDMVFPTLWLASSAIVGLMALYQFLILRNIVFILTDEQLIIRKGVLIRTCSYLELYRIVDFTEHQNPLQQILGLKTVFLYSTDRTNPTLEIFGLLADSNIVYVIRNRVIHNRTKRNIHEISNLI